MLGQFNVQKFVSSMKGNGGTPHSLSSWLQKARRQLMDKSLYAVGFCSELLSSPDDTLLFSLDRYAEKDLSRKKAVFHHKVDIVRLKHSTSFEVELCHINFLLAEISFVSFLFYVLAFHASDNLVLMSFAVSVS